MKSDLCAPSVSSVSLWLTDRPGHSEAAATAPQNARSPGKVYAGQNEPT